MDGPAVSYRPLSSRKIFNRLLEKSCQDCGDIFTITIAALLRRCGCASGSSYTGGDDERTPRVSPPEHHNTRDDYIPHMSFWRGWLVWIGLLLVLVVSLGFGAGVLSPGSDYRGGYVEGCQVERAPVNATVIPASNATVQDAQPVLQAVENATRDDSSHSSTHFSPDEQASVVAFTTKIPWGPSLTNGSDCRGGYYVRSQGEVVVVSVAINT